MLENSLNAIPLFMLRTVKLFLVVFNYSSLTKNSQTRNSIAFKISSGEIAAPVNISVKSAFSICSEITRKSWQRSWDNEPTGRSTHEFIPTVYTKILFPLQRSIGISYCRLLLHDTMLKDDSFRSDTSTSPICDCGLQRETAEHFLLHCTLYIRINVTIWLINYNNSVGLKRINLYRLHTVCCYLLMMNISANIVWL